jgi:protein-S-isoprenylcysteine O-methyltransferase Ste14
MDLTKGIEKVTRAAGIYFLVQGLAVFGWWATLLTWPSTRTLFALDPRSDTPLLSFWLADLSLLGIGSVIAGIMCIRGSEFIKPIVWLITGAITYATLYCLAFTLLTDAGWLGIILMFPAMIWSGVFATGLAVPRAMFRQSADRSPRWIAAKTLIQIIVVWGIILGVVPYLITVIEDKVGLGRLHFPYQKSIAWVLFFIISSFGIWAAMVMSKTGEGTPLPLDHAKKLVFRGPYAFVRNPMAVSGIGQGLAVALLLGSGFVALYALMGSLIWQLVFRPLEEDDLRARFGSDYEKYADEVKCWVPRSKPYQIDGTADSSNSIVSPSGRM